MISRLPRLGGALLAVLLLSTGALPAHAAKAARAGDGPVAPSPKLVVTGNGWGHGHGMSQWGAQGAALAGKSYQQILGFYYPGTGLSTIGGKVRVLITANTRSNLKVKAAPGLKLVDLGRHKKYALPSARAWKLKTVKGHTRVYRKTGGWHRYRPGGHPYLAGDGQFKSASHLVTVKLPSGKRTYRGAVRFTHQDTVNVLSLEKYLRGVVPAEVYTTWEPAALQAQAVAARTYAAFERADNAARYFHVYDSTRSQVYSGYAGEHPRTDAAIAATAGRVVVHGGKLAFTQFSSSSGGATSAGGQTYLKSQLDPYDKAVSPYLGWKATVDTAVLEKAFPAVGTLQSLQITKREGPVGAEWGGWVEEVTLHGDQDVVISGAKFRSVLGLRSAYFTF